MIEELIQDTDEYSAAGPHIWMGDFNADIWDRSETPEGGDVMAQMIMSAPELHQPRATRGTAPDRIKQQGNVLLSAAAATASAMLTGRKGDSGGATFHGSGGEGVSRIDHVAVHHSLWRGISSSRVLNTDRILSDHQPVQATFHPPTDSAIDAGTDPRPPRPAASQLQPTRLTWRQDRAAQYCAALAADVAGLRQLDDVIAADDDEGTVAALSTVIVRAAGSCGMVSKEGGPRGRGTGRVQRPLWWGPEVQSAYAALRQASLEGAPGSVRRTAKQRYRATARRHRRRHNRYLAAQIADRLARHDRNVHREHLAQPRQHCPATAVSAEAWEAHLRRQFTATPPGERVR